MIYARGSVKTEPYRTSDYPPYVYFIVSGSVKTEPYRMSDYPPYVSAKLITHYALRITH